MSHALGHFGDESGNPREPLAAGEYAVPNEIKIEGEKLAWRYGSSSRIRKVRPGARMLLDFLALSDTDVANENVLSYAKRWGVLNLCKAHLMPASHNPNCEPSQVEPLSEWRFLARQMKAFLEIAVGLDRDRKLGKREDWQVLTGEDFEGELVPGRDLSHWKPGWRNTEKNLSRAIAFEKNHIAYFINFWLQVGGVYPIASWRGDSISLNLEGSPKGKMFGALAIQLMQEAGRCTFLFCRNCRKTFTPETRQSRYCAACRELGVPQQRAADRRNRARTGSTQPQ